jgi:hypothetical protein
MALPDEEPTRVSRRHVLGLLTSATIGGLAGCGGDDGEPTETTEPMETTEQTETTAPTETTETETETETATDTPTLPDDPDPLVSIDGSQFRPIFPGETVTLSTSFVNPYLFDVENGEVTLEASDDGFEISEGTGTTFETLEAQASQDVEWEVTVPEEPGEYELTATVTYSVGGETAELPVTVAVNAAGIEERDDEIFITQTGGGVPDEPTFTLLPEGDDISDNDNQNDADGPDDVSADFYFGYDADNLYLRAEITDDTHITRSGVDMWQKDNIQYAAGIDGTYGPEDGITHHEDGTTEMWRWIQGTENESEAAVDATTSRDDANNLTTYEATIPWEALFAESKGPGDSFRFSVQVNEADSEDGNRDVVLGWTLPGINDDKTYGALGVFHLEES